MTRLLGGSATCAGLGGSTADVLTAVRRLSGDLDWTDPRCVQRIGDGVLHGMPRSLFGFDSSAPSAHGLADAQQRGLFHGGQYATPMWLARGNPMCHTDVAVVEHINVAVTGGEMTKTEAAQIIASRAATWARKTGQPVTPLVIDEHISEGHHSAPDTYLGRAARTANYKTAYRLTCQSLRRTGHDHLIGK